MEDWGLERAKRQKSNPDVAKIKKTSPKTGKKNSQKKRGETH
jgi:hypothetical protein